MYVCHHCDVRLCCNPDHLFLGTAADNMHDAMSKDRHSHGERHKARMKRGEAMPHSKLTDAEVLEIRRLSQTDGPTRDQIATAFGVSTQAVKAIVLRKTWTHLPAVSLNDEAAHYIITPAQVREARRVMGTHTGRHCGYTQTEFGKLLGRGMMAVCNWENGRVRVPGPVAVVMNIALDEAAGRTTTLDTLKACPLELETALNSFAEMSLAKSKLTLDGDASDETTDDCRVSL